MEQKNKFGNAEITLANSRQCRHSADMKPKTFRTKKAAQAAVEECQSNGWRAGIVGSGPWRVQATGYADNERVRIIYDLHEDGMMREYSRRDAK